MMTSIGGQRGHTAAKCAPFRFARLTALSVCCLAVASARGDSAAPKPARPSPIVCEGDYQYHVQGVATDGKSIFWSFTTALVKTGLDGKLAAKVEVSKGHHMGDLKTLDGKVYVGMNMSGVRKRAGDEVWVYDAATLELVRKIPTPQTIWCNNGLAWHDGFFYVIGSASDHMPYNFVHVYDKDWGYFGVRAIESGWTMLGVQTVAAFGESLVFGYYGNAKDELMPHRGGAFVVSIKDLQSNWRNRERADIVPIRERFDGGFAEGMLELDGEPWRCRGFLCPTAATGGEKRYGAELLPAPEIAAALRRVESAKERK
ncbi:MAG: hypothetical protein ACI4RD_07310 [Kiritimatiellia bacterium]